MTDSTDEIPGVMVDRYTREREDFAAEYKRRMDQLAAKRKDEDKARVVVILLAIPIFLCCFWILPSYFEAKTFSRLTGKSVSTWDAMWVELRIEGTNGE